MDKKLDLRSIQNDINAELEFIDWCDKTIARIKNKEFERISLYFGVTESTLKLSLGDAVDLINVLKAKSRVTLSGLKTGIKNVIDKVVED